MRQARQAAFDRVQDLWWAWQLSGIPWPIGFLNLGLCYGPDIVTRYFFYILVVLQICGKESLVLASDYRGDVGNAVISQKQLPTKRRLWNPVLFMVGSLCILYPRLWFSMPCYLCCWIPPRVCLWCVCVQACRVFGFLLGACLTVVKKIIVPLFSYANC